MALRPYRNETQEWLEATYLETMRGLSSGKQVISTSAGDTSVSFSNSSNPWLEVSRIIFELHVRDPEKWPADMLLQNRTRANHSA